MRKVASAATRFGKRFGWLLALTPVWGCGGDDGAVATTTTSDCVGLAVAPGTAKIGVGKTQNFAATCTSGTATGATWTSSNPAVATVDVAGVAKGLGKGSTTITATVGSATATATLDVSDGAVVSIQVTPATATVPKGATQTFIATANKDDGTTEDVSAKATWKSSDTAVATIDATGKATALKAGASTITADFGGKNGSAALTVNEDVPKAVTVTCTPAVVAAGAATSCKASATMSDASIVDVTSSATWSTADTKIATVSDAAGTKGSAKGIASGKTQVTAVYAGVTGSADLEVGSATLTSVTINPGAAVAGRGTTSKFLAQANYADGTFGDVTDTAVWTSSDVTKATVDKGLATALDTGTVTITAEFSGQKGTATLAISTGTPTKLDITPPTVALARGTTQAMTATTTNSDGTTSNVTSSASWSSADATIATVSVSGLVTGVKAGTTKITSNFAGLTATADITVTDATVDELAITPAGPLSLPIGLRQKFTALAKLSDGTTKDVSDVAVFSSSTAGILTIEGGSLLLGTKVGTSNLTATFGGKTSNIVAITVTDAVILTIDVTPASPADLPIGASLPFKATATLSAGAPLDVTSAVAWSSTDTTVASIGASGIALAIKGGSTTIVATKGTVKSSPVKLVVKPASVTLSSIAVSPAVGTVINKGFKQVYAATGTYSDASTADITFASSTVWDVVDSANLAVSPAIATVSAGTASGNGSTATLTGGKAYVRARQAALTARGELTVKDTKVTSIAVTCTDTAGNGGKFIQCVPAGISFPIVCTALATFADATKSDVTADVAWNSSASTSAVFAKVLGGKAVFTAISPGKAIAIATYKNPDATSTASWVTGAAEPVTATITVATRTLTDTALIGPAGNRLNLGNKFNYRLTGSYGAAATCPTTGTPALAGVYEVTRLASYTSTFPTTASISNAEGSVGLASALTAGATSIGASFGGFSKTLPLNVTARCVKTLDLSPKNPTVPTKTYTKLAITATYSDDKTEEINYATAPGNRLRFTTPAGEAGFDTVAALNTFPSDNQVFLNTYEVYSGAAVGTTAYTATLTTANGACAAGLVSNTSTFTRQTGLLPLALKVSPSDITIPKGGNFTSTVTGTYTTATGTSDYNVSYVGTGPGGLGGNGTLQAFAPDLKFTPDYRWTNTLGTSCLGAKNCGGGSMAIGWVQATPAVTGVMTATYTLGARSTLQTVTVTGKTVTTVTIAGWRAGEQQAFLFPYRNTSVPVGVNPRMLVNVQYSDGSIDNELTLAGSLFYESSDPSKLNFASPFSNVGTTLSAGNAVVTVSVGGIKSAPVTFVINTRILCDMYGSAPGAPGGNTMMKNSLKRVVITGRYADTDCISGTGWNYDISDSVVSSSGDTSVISVKTDYAGTVVRSFGTPSPTGILVNFSKDGLIRQFNMVVLNATSCITGVTITDPPGPVTLPRGAPVDIKYSCTFTGAPVVCNVTSFRSSTSGFVATIPGDFSFSTGGHGTVDVAATGSTDISVVLEDNACVGGAVSESRTITRGLAKLSSVLLSPTDSTVPLRGLQQYRVDAIYDDGSSYNVSRAVGAVGLNKLSSASTLVSFINNSRAVGSTTTPGVATINATYNDGDSAKTSNPATLNITSATRTSVFIDAPLHRVTGTCGVTAGGGVIGACYPEGGMALQLRAREILSTTAFGSDITDEVTWSLDAPILPGASIDSTGLFITPTDVAADADQIVRASDGTLARTFRIRIINGAVTSIVVLSGGESIATATLLKGVSQRFDAQVSVAGASYWAARNVNWTSSNTARVSIVATGASAGLANPVAVGTATLTAARDAATTPVALTVSTSAPTSIYCAPKTATVANGFAIRLKIIARLTDGSEADVTTGATYANFVAGAVTGSASLRNDIVPGWFLASGTGGNRDINVNRIILGTPFTSAPADKCYVTVNP